MSSSLQPGRQDTLSSQAHRLPPDTFARKWGCYCDVEQAVGKLKQAGAVAARHDRRGYVCLLGAGTAAALVIRLRT
ncbi:hypothetical protein [Kitasatospora griseola]|uniref:hypothetical protein n=1 Tax=Kitasatospora griseola TaxID=2064 RepID=UPI003801AA0C